MRAIYIFLPKDRVDMINRILSTIPDLMVWEMSSKDKVLIIITVPLDRVEEVLDKLKKVGVGRLYGNFHVYPIEAASNIPPATVKKRAYREEILNDIRAKAVLDKRFVSYVIMSAILATLGIISNNIVVLLSSVIISPMLNPILATSLGFVLGRKRLTREGLRSEIAGLVLTVFTSFGIGLIANPMVSETLQAYTNWGIESLIFATIAGGAIAISVVSARMLEVVGVALLSSIIPPAAGMGLSLSLVLRGNPLGISIFAGSTIIMLMNLVAIMFMSMVIFWIENLFPSESARKRKRAMLFARRGIIVFAFIFGIVFSLAAYRTYLDFMDGEREKALSASTVEWLQTHYPSLGIENVDVLYSREKNSARVYICVVVSNQSMDFGSIPSELADYLSRKYGIKINIVMEIHIGTTVSWNPCSPGIS